MTIKKAYTEVHALLVSAKADKKIDENVFQKAVELMSAKRGGSSGETTAIRNDKGEVVAVRCFYYKRWMPVVGDKAVEFGVKKTTSTGLNTMCKAGSSLYTKQLSAYKKAKEEMLDKVSSGEVKPADVKANLEKLEKDRHTIAKTELGFAKREDCEKYLETVK